MARPKLPPGDTHAEYNVYRLLADAEGENNDCTIRAVASVTGKDYKSVLTMFTAAGRMPGRPTKLFMAQSVIELLGFKHRMVPLSDFNPPARAARGKYGITSHHPDRFPHMWKGRGNFLCWNSGHMWAVVDGLNTDWSRGKAVRIHWIMKVEPQ